MKIGLLGFGTVGSGVYEILKSSSTCFFNDIEVKKILVKDEKDKVMDIITTNAEEILNDKDINLVVEVMGGIHPAYEYIIKSLKNKKNVVTANKAVVAAYLKEFTKTAYENGVSFEYEASVCGGIPWIKSLEKAKRIDEISEVYGIFNGTSNFILDNMTKKGYEFQEILKKAQEKGYAESDPSADIDGIDIMRKLLITSSLAFECEIPEKEIDVFGIRNIQKKDIEYFNNIGYTVKLIAKGKKVENRYCAVVEPVLFKNDRIEAAVPQNFNIGTISGKTIGELKFYGQGAGKLPTGNAIVQDIIDIMEAKGNLIERKFEKSLIKDSSLISGKYYIRINDEQFAEDNSDIIEKKIEYSGNIIYITREINCSVMKKIAEKYLEKEIFYARFEN
ncbi:homoserine dehydrogenase [Fusobacterium varium]|uniref:homoserine dehydrogenase n=1 Tax=Fusobacterium varium TaxID=856 RepID=UPI00356837A4